MKYSTLIKDMIEEGATPEMILVAVRAVERQEEDALERRRASDRARQERHRNVMSRDKTLDNVSHAPSRSHAGVEDKTSSTEIEPPEVRKKAARGTRLTADWRLPVEWRQDALDAGLPEHMIDTQAIEMRDWSMSSPKGVKLDWRATWRGWCRRAAKDLPRAGPPRVVPMKDTPANAARRRIEAIENERRNGSETNDHQQVAGLISGNTVRLVG